METEFVVVLTTWPAGRDVAPFARALVEARLAACVNVLPPMRSFYRWEGAVLDEEERQLIPKTTADRLDALQARVRELHPYDIPEWLVLPVSRGGAAYLDWVRTSVGDAGPPR